MQNLQEDKPSVGNEEMLPAFSNKKKLLNPVDRISEVLFGLIMALTFTCTISVAEADRREVRSMLFAAIGCNIAWGLVDAVMFIFKGLAEKGHGKTILKFVKSNSHHNKANELIADALPPVVTSALSARQMDDIRNALLNTPEPELKIRVTLTDVKMATQIFFLVFISTIPIALPFVFIRDVQLGLRVSNLIAIVCMFTSGWLLAKYGGYNKWVMGFAMSLLGAVLVGITIALGG